MAFIDYDSDDPVGHASFYNVTQAVGYGCPNMLEDVKVVQFFLKRLFSLEGLKKDKPWGEMTIDGKVGPITRAWIIKTQILCREGGTNVLVDGIVDKAGNPNNASNWESSISHTKYVIRMINNTLRKRDTVVYKTLTSNPEVPPDMRVIFLQIQAAGPQMNYGNS